MQFTVIVEASCLLFFLILIFNQYTTCSSQKSTKLLLDVSNLFEAFLRLTTPFSLSLLYQLTKVVLFQIQEDYLELLKKIGKYFYFATAKI